MTQDLLHPDIAASIAHARHDDPFSVLGLHPSGQSWVIRAFVPGATSASAIGVDGALLARLSEVAGTGVFVGLIDTRPADGVYRLALKNDDADWTMDDAYRFGPVLGDLDEHLIAEGSHLDLWRAMGAHLIRHEGVDGVHFAVWAPNARRVAVVGDFNHWDGRLHAMRRRGSSGIWEIFLPGVAENARYKFEIRSGSAETPVLKSDPFGFGAEHPPATASVVRGLTNHGWTDADWMTTRHITRNIDQPISIYEAHLGSWRKADNGARVLAYAELADSLVSHVREMGFTHIELLPITEHPFDGSWGYQPIGLYAPTCRHGSPDDFRAFVDACHDAGIGLILDWVPGHFPTDQHGLREFDGTPLYEHADPREGFHQDWNTLIFNYGRREVANYLLANAVFWLKEFHIDGLRVDAVASMLYRDYSRAEGEWIPNRHGGRENLEAIAFLSRMNEVAYGSCDGILTIAEESTAFPGVSSPTSHGGLGFGYKWNMGWMNDTLSYMSHDPIHRRYHHHLMTFGLHYAFTENFILPLSHDEVVHGKGSLLSRMPGSGGDKFANLRAYYAFMWMHPGKKLLFMGQEFAQGAEWNHDQSLDWHLLDIGWHKGIQSLIKDLNTLYRSTPALYQQDCKAEGFDWIDGGNAGDSVFSWIRLGFEGSSPVVVVCNMTPVQRDGFRLGVPLPGSWHLRLNTDATRYCGDGRGTVVDVTTDPQAWNGRDQSILLSLPPLSALVFEFAKA